MKLATGNKAGMSVTKRRKIAERSTKCHVSCTSRIGTCCVDRARSAGGGGDVKKGRGETNAGADVINASGVDSSAAAVAATDVMVLAGGLLRQWFAGVGSPQELADVINANGVGSPQEVADVINANGVGSLAEQSKWCVGSLALECRAYTGDEYHRLANSAR